MHAKAVKVKRTKLSMSILLVRQQLWGVMPTLSSPLQAGPDFTILSKFSHNHIFILPYDFSLP